MTDPTDKKLCFVIAPIGDLESETRKRSDQVLKHVIRPAVEKCGYEAKRADEIDKPGVITSQVIQHVVNDALVVADLTERNPNVFYELAIRHAIRKPLVQLIKKGEQIPFDVAGTRTIYVDHKDLDSVETARNEIVAQISALENDPSDLETPISVSLDLQLLRQSDDPEDRSLADILSAVSELRATVGKLEAHIGVEDGGGAFGELLQMINSIHRRLEESDAPYSVRSRFARRVFHEYYHDLFRGPGAESPTFGILVLSSFFKDTLPWLYEMGVNVYRLLQEGKTAAAKRAVSEFGHHVEHALNGPVLRAAVPRSRDFYMLHERMEPIWAHVQELLEREFPVEKQRPTK